MAEKKVNWEKIMKQAAAGEIVEPRPLEQSPSPERPVLLSPETTFSRPLTERPEPVSGREANSMAAVAGLVAADYGREYKRVEKILEDGLAESYLKMTPIEQQLFKRKGEETARAVLQAVSQSKIKIKRIIDLIKNWLKLIPGINRFFLEQTAKIKTDKILSAVGKGKRIV